MAINLYKARKDYLSFMEAQGMSSRTIQGHSQTLDHALNAWGNIDMRDVSPAHIDKMFSKKKWSTGTRNNYLWNLRGFLKWCRVHGIIPVDYDPTAGWKTHKMEKKKKTWLTVSELKEVLDFAFCERDRAFIAIGMYTFMRSSEIVNLKIKDIDLEYNEVDIYRVKTRQHDTLPICSELHEELVNYFKFYEMVAGPLQPEWYVVPARGPQPMTGVSGKRTLVPTGDPAPFKPESKITKPYSIVKRAMEKINKDEVGEGCHTLRRSGARELFEQLRSNGHDGAARRVQSMLGHTSVVMTEIYLGIDSEKRERNRMLCGQPMFSAA